MEIIEAIVPSFGWKGVYVPLYPVLGSRLKEFVMEGEEIFADEDDVTLSNCVVESGYVRRAYSDYTLASKGGTDDEGNFDDSVYRGQFNTLAWTHLGSHYKFMGNGDDGNFCARVMNNAKTSRIFTMVCAYIYTTNYVYNNYYHTSFNWELPLSTTLRLCVAGGASPRAGYRYTDAASGTNNKRKIINCPSSGSLVSTKRQCKQYFYACDFGDGDTRSVEKTTSDIAAGEIVKATVSITDLTALGGTGGSNTLYVSRDGGTTWCEVSDGVEYEFAGAEATKNQFKWKIEIGQADRGSSEVIDLIEWTYTYLA